MRLLPAVGLEPPPDYIEFVATHLAPLRTESAAVVGDARYADELYPEVLTDVAIRWRWLRGPYRRLGPPNAAEQYLRRAFARRSQRWYAARAAPDGPAVEFEVWSGERASWTPRPAVARRESRAIRLASFVLPPSTEAGPLAEAAIAWWHAYEAHRRRRLVAFLMVLLVAFVLMWQLRPLAP